LQLLQMGVTIAAMQKPMDLKTYIHAAPGNGGALAQKLGIPAAFLSQMAGGGRSVSPARAVEIERATSGDVSRFDLRPEDGREIWPEEWAKRQKWDRKTERRIGPADRRQD
jgi:DNA-binding transcriptional regulator YdaS (Cro superfamily)